MPKYYRFRATTPTRKPKRCREKEKEKEEVEKVKNVPERSWMDVTVACAPAPSWYLRRIAWRESPPLMGLPRELAASLRASLQLSNRPVFVFKMDPSTLCQDMMHPM